MPKRIIHNATVTLKLPFDIGAGAELTALREAGIRSTLWAMPSTASCSCGRATEDEARPTSSAGLPARSGRRDR